MRPGIRPRIAIDAAELGRDVVRRRRAQSLPSESSDVEFVGRQVRAFGLRRTGMRGKMTWELSSKRLSLERYLKGRS